MIKTIQEHRENIGATPEQLAKAVGVSAVTLMNWEKGKGSPKIPQASKIVDFFKSNGLDITVDNIRFTVK